MTDPQTISLTLMGTILVASVLGSLHCAGMCGGLVLFVVGADGSCSKTVRLQVAYHGGRGVAYTALGALAGSAGSLANDAGQLAGFQQTAAIGAGSVMIVFGVVAFMRALGANTPRVRVPVKARRWIEKAHRGAMTLTPTRRALGVGLLTPLLPCGWLYAFVTASAGTGTAWGGGLVMAGFWVGTLPVLATLGLGLGALTGPLRSRVPVISSAIIVAFGVMTALGRVSVPIPSYAPTEGSSLVERVEHVRTLDHADLPCCAVPDESTEPDS